MFQSSPSPKAGSYITVTANMDAGWKVSILSQPEGRELRAVDIVAADFGLFQSSPSPKAGSYMSGR